MGPPITDSIPLIIALVVMIVAAAFLGAAEASLLRVSRVRAELMAERGDRPAQRVRRLTDRLTHTMNAVLLLVLLLQVGAATIAGIVAERHFGSAGVTAGSIALTLVMFVYAEAVPKTMAVRLPLQTARMVSGPVTLLVAAVRPVVRLLVAFADLQAPGRGVETGVSVTEAELIRLAAEAEAAGAIEPTDRELIERAFVVGDTRVAAILVPRIDMVAVAEDSTVRAALDAAVAAGHRRLPVYRDDLDDVTGVVRLRDLARAMTEEEDLTVRDLQRDVLVVPETRRLIDTLRDMQRAARSLAVVVDEHGGTAGIVTIEDVVEELVGEISDEDIAAVPDVRAAGEGRWLVAGSADLRELQEALGTELPGGDWSTAAGLVIGLAGRIPSPGDTVSVPGFRLEVTAATRRRVRRIVVTAEDPSDPNARDAPDAAR